MNVEHRQNYRDVLRGELGLRQQHNPHYSLRAFARDLGVSASRLSQIMNRRKGLSSKAARDIAAKLSLSPKETRWFCDLVDSEHARTNEQRLAAQQSIASHRKALASHPLDEERLRVIGSWHHFAILELIAIDGEGATEKSIAKRLAMPVAEVRAALDRLQHIGLLKIEKGRYELLHSDTLAGGDVPSAVRKSFHEGLMAKARHALYFQEVGLRDFSAMIMCIHPDKIDEAKKMLLEFRRRFCQTMEQREPDSDVYCLSMGLFSLTEGVKIKSEGV